MRVKTREEEHGRVRHRRFGKKFWASIIFSFILLSGVATWVIVNAISTIGASAVISYDTSKGYHGSDSDQLYELFYGKKEGSSWQMWSTKWYTVTTGGVTHDATCLEPRKPEATSTTATVGEITNNNDLKRILLVTLADSNSGSPINYYSQFANSFDWDANSSQVHCLRSLSGCGVTEGGLYTTYMNGHPTRQEYIYILGHIMAGRVYTGEYYSLLNSSDASTIDGFRSTINTWFSNNYPNAINDFRLFTAKGGNSGNQIVAWLEYSPATVEVHVQIEKVDSETGTTTNGSLSVVGTQFGVYNSSNVQVATITIGNNGTGRTSQPLGAGTYTIKEISATSGYNLNTAAITVTITNNDNGKTINLTGTTTPCTNGSSYTYGSSGCRFENTPTKKARIKIKKLNSENQTVSYAGLTVAGTVFSVKNSSGTEVTTITIGNDGTGTSGPLDAGTYTITEKTATTGYKTNGAVLTVTIRNSDLGVNNPILDYSTSTTACTTSSTAPCTFFNDLIKGKISLTKTGYELSASGTAGKRNLAGIYFEATNQSDTSIKYTIGGTASDGTLTTQDMVYGTYKAKELRRAGSNNNAYKLLEFTFTITSSTTSTNTATISIVSGTGTLDGGTLRDDIPDNPNLHTVARNTSSTAASPSKDIEISDSAGVTDRITCSGLEANAEYKFDGTLWDKAASTQVKISSSNTNNVTGTVTFTADSNGKCNGNTGIDMDFARFDSSAYMGKTLAIKQVLFKNNGTTASPDWVRIAIHNSDLTDTDEEVKVSTIQITSSATTGRSNNKELTAGSVKIIDAVTIRGLTNGVSYKIIAQVKDASNNLVTIKDANGHTGTSITENYTMAAATGTSITVTMDIYLDSTPYVGQNLSVYLTLQLANGTTIATHNPPANGSETVSVVTPTIGTTAVNAHNTSSKEIEVGTIDATNGSPTIQDTIAYTGLTVGNVYTLVGEVWKLDANGNAVTKVATNGPTGHSFTASTENGTETVTFPVDTVTNCATNNRLSMPCKFVVYEYIYMAAAIHHLPAMPSLRILRRSYPSNNPK